MYVLAFWKVTSLIHLLRSLTPWSGPPQMRAKSPSFQIEILDSQYSRLHQHCRMSPSVIGCYHERLPMISIPCFPSLPQHGKSAKHQERNPISSTPQTPGARAKSPLLVSQNRFAIEIPKSFCNTSLTVVYKTSAIECSSRSASLLILDSCAQD
jgi:hypothetical protein